MSEEENKSEPRFKIRMVFAGNISAGDKEIRAVYHLVENGRADVSKPLHFSKSKHGGRPGTVYEFDAAKEDGSTIYPTTYKYIGHITDKDIDIDLFRSRDEYALPTTPDEVELDAVTEAAKWQARHDTARLNREQKLSEERGKNVNVIRDQLDPVRAAYWSMQAPQREIFLAQVVSYITGYRSPKKKEKSE